MGEAELRQMDTDSDQICSKQSKSFGAKRDVCRRLARRSIRNAQCLAGLGGRLDDDKLHKLSLELRNEKISRDDIYYALSLETYRELICRFILRTYEFMV